MLCAGTEAGKKFAETKPTNCELVNNKRIQNSRMIEEIVFFKLNAVTN
jgi:hypothetical protein